MSWIMIVFVFFVTVFPSISIVSFLAAIFASIGLFIGLLAVMTGVSILPMSAPRAIFVVGEEAESAGRFQVAWSVGVLILVIAIEILRRYT